MTLCVIRREWQLLLEINCALAFTKRLSRYYLGSHFTHTDHSTSVTIIPFEYQQRKSADT